MFLFGGGGSNNSNNKQSQNENSDDNLGKALRNKIVNIYINILFSRLFNIGRKYAR